MVTCDAKPQPTNRKTVIITRKTAGASQVIWGDYRFGVILTKAPYPITPRRGGTQARAGFDVCMHCACQSGDLRSWEVPLQLLMSFLLAHERDWSRATVILTQTAVFGLHFHYGRTM